MDINLQKLSEVFMKMAQEKFLLLLEEYSNYLLKNNILSDSENNLLSYQKNISSKIGWLIEEGKLFGFFTLLSKYGFIACDFEIFKNHFVGTNVPTESIKWLTYNNRLVYLFSQLMGNKIIPESDTQHQLLTEHFIDKSGNKLKKGSLRSLLNEIDNTKMKCIDDIFKELERIV